MASEIFRWWLQTRLDRVRLALKNWLMASSPKEFSDDGGKEPAPPAPPRSDSVAEVAATTKLTASEKAYSVALRESGYESLKLSILKQGARAGGFVGDRYVEGLSTLCLLEAVEEIRVGIAECKQVLTNGLAEDASKDKARTALEKLLKQQVAAAVIMREWRKIKKTVVVDLPKQKTPSFPAHVPVVPLGGRNVNVLVQSGGQVLLGQADQQHVNGDQLPTEPGGGDDDQATADQCPSGAEGAT